MRAKCELILKKRFCTVIILSLLLLFLQYTLICSFVSNGTCRHGFLI
jgi:hypothetical protein